MTMYTVFIGPFYVVAWGVVFAGSAILLRRGYASAAVSMLLGSAISLLITLLNMLMTMRTMYRWIREIGSERITMMTGLISAVGMLLFALGFLQLARMVKREG